MATIHTQDIVDAVIDEANNKFGSSWVLSEQKMDRVRTVCPMIDELVECVDAESVSASIDEETMRLHITVVCNAIDTSDIRQPTNHVFFRIIQLVSLFRFSGSEDGETITVDFQFNDLWERK